MPWGNSRGEYGWIDSAGHMHAEPSPFSPVKPHLGEQPSYHPPAPPPLSPLPPSAEPRITFPNFPGYVFEGPIICSEDLLEKPAVYLVLERKKDELWHPITAGHTTNMWHWVVHHFKKKPIAKDHSTYTGGEIGLAVIYNPEQSREELYRQFHFILWGCYPEAE